jgi:hypothetical protein
MTASAPLLDPVLEPPLPLEVLDRPFRVLTNGAGALVRAEPRVVVDRVLGEVRGDEVGIAGVERAVVATDVLEVAQRPRLWPI